MAATQSGKRDRNNWSLACFQDLGGKSNLALIQCKNGNISATQVPQSAPSGNEDALRPVFLAMTTNGKAVIMNPQTKALQFESSVPADVFGIYYYPDHELEQLWLTNDGNQDGVDTGNCGENGASVIVATGLDRDTRIVKTICLGRGHHVVATTGTRAPHKAFVSSLLEGTLTFIANDPNAGDHLEVLETISLCQPDKEKDGIDTTPNNAFPHGMVYSAVTDRVYCLNNGYGNINVINPHTHKIEKRIDMKVSSNLLLSPCGRFALGKGADRKENPDHVMGRLCVLNLETENMDTSLDIPDFYPSTYRFTPDGKKLYVTTAATGKGAQKDNLDIDHVYVYDTSALPALTLIKKIKVGKADCGRRSMALLADASQTHFVFIPNPTEGTVSILDGETDEVVQTVKVGDTNAKETAFSYWDGTFYGS